MHCELNVYKTTGSVYELFIIFIIQNELLKIATKCFLPYELIVDVIHGKVAMGGSSEHNL
jgi:hypothetical protein